MHLSCLTYGRVPTMGRYYVRTRNLRNSIHFYVSRMRKNAYFVYTLCYYGFFIVTYFLHDAHCWRSSLYYLHTTIPWILLIQIRRTLCLFKFLCNFKSVIWVLLNVKRNTWLQTVKKYANQLQHKFYKFRNLHKYWYSLSMNDYDQLFFFVAFY